MGFHLPRPAIFRRSDPTEENYLVLMHYLAVALWDKGLAVAAVSALRTVLTKAHDGRPQRTAPGQEGGDREGAR